jgi:uncharacterized protein (DUF1697 family)
MPVHIALLRAVNVAGTGKLPMQELRQACTAAGLRRSVTYIASGNLLFESDLDAAGAAEVVTGVLRDRFGLVKNDVIVRSPAQIEAALAANPLPEPAAERPNLYYAAFLAGPLTADAGARVSAWAGPERIVFGDGHVYIDYPNGAGTSKLTPAALERMLGTPSTARNWNTVNKLAELARGM